MFAVLQLMGVAFVGSVFWVVSTEGAAMYYGGAEAWPAPFVGLACATAQTAMYVILYFGGERVVRRWRWLRRTVTRTRERFAKHLETSFLTLTGVAAVLGMPPVVALIALASSFGIGWQQALPVAFVGRFVRFTVLAWAGESLLAWWAAL